MYARFLSVPLLAAMVILPALGQETLPPLSEKPVLSEPAEKPVLSEIVPGDLVPSNGGRIWFEADAQAAWLKGMRLPPLVTTSPPGTAQINAGVLGLHSTTVLFGADRVDGDLRGGIKFDLGCWLDADHRLGIDAGYGILEGQGAIFNETSTGGSPILARPFVDANTHKDTALLVGFPGVSSGSVGVNASSNNFQDAHADFRQRYPVNDQFRIDWLIGYRYLRYDEDLIIFEKLQPIGSSFVKGTTITGNDRFGTRNQFNGGEIGFDTQYDFQRFSVQAVGRLAVGNLERQVNIQGSQNIIVPGTAPLNFPANLLALSSNTGSHGIDDWMAIPEIDLNLIYRLRENIKLKLGYTFLYFPELARAGDEVNLAVNQTLLPNHGPKSGPNEPAFILRRTDLWVQGVNLGFEISY